VTAIAVDAPARTRARPPVDWPIVALYAFLTVYSVANLFPLLWVLLSSLKSTNEIYETVLALPREWRFYNYAEAWEHARIGRYFLNSALVAVPTLVIVLLFGSMAAYALVRLIPSVALYNYFVLGLVVPVHVILIPTFIIIRQMGLLNSPLALILVYSASNLPLAVFILVGFIRSIPAALEEAATIDGAGVWTIYTQVILPLSRPGLAVIATLTFLSCWNEYLVALVMMSASEFKTLPQGIASLRGAQTIDYGLQTAGLVISILPVLIVYIIFQEQFIKGATAGSSVG
jgi:raffinose/stachyose/melibiose transport system permease protein